MDGGQSITLALFGGSGETGQQMVAPATGKDIQIRTPRFIREAVFLTHSCRRN
jgi:hypothetical protein